ncbi:hypothetical protein FALCPG4_006350 [Fusarium falciforme]
MRVPSMGTYLFFAPPSASANWKPPAGGQVPGRYRSTALVLKQAPGLVAPPHLLPPSPILLRAVHDLQSSLSLLSRLLQALPVYGLCLSSLNFFSSFFFSLNESLIHVVSHSTPRPSSPSTRP